LRAGEEERDGRRCAGAGELRPLDNCVDFLQDWINREVREMRWVKRGGWGGVEEGVLLADVGIERGGSARDSSVLEASQAAEQKGEGRDFPGLYIGEIA
jgi:hypothetical protein